MVTLTTDDQHLTVKCVDPEPPNGIFGSYLYEALKNQLELGFDVTVYYSNKIVREKPDFVKKHDLFFCFYHTPTDVKQNKSKKRYSTVYFRNYGRAYLEKSQQRISFPVGDIPKHYKKIISQDQKIIALQQENSFWFLPNLLSRENWEILTFFKGLQLQNPDLFVNVLLTEEDRAQLEKNKIKSWFELHITKERDSLANTLQRCERNMQTYEQQFRNYALTYHQELNRQQPILERLNHIDLNDLVTSVFNVGFVDTVTAKNNKLIVTTKELRLGNVSYGKYTVTFDTNTFHNPTIQTPLPLTDKYPCHPYQFSDGHFCYGDYEDVLAKALASLRVDHCLFIIEKLLLNYSVETRIYPLEKYLIQINKLKNKEELYTLINPEYKETHIVGITTVTDGVFRLTQRTINEQNRETYTTLETTLKETFHVDS